LVKTNLFCKTKVYCNNTVYTRIYINEINKIKRYVLYQKSYVSCLKFKDECRRVGNYGRDKFKHILIMQPSMSNKKWGTNIIQTAANLMYFNPK